LLVEAKYRAVVLTVLQEVSICIGTQALPTPLMQTDLAGHVVTALVLLYEALAAGTGLHCLGAMKLLV